jgi:hypothetical protein
LLYIYTLHGVLVLFDFEILNVVLSLISVAFKLRLKVN